MVEGDQPVGEDEGGVGHRGPVGAAAFAVGLQLVAEVADEAAVEVERQVVGEIAQAPHLPAQVVEDRLGQHLGLAAPLDAHLTGADVVGDRRAERPATGAHEGEAGALVEPAAVEPEGVGAVAVEVDEGALGVVEGVQPLHLQLELRPPPDALRRPGGSAWRRRVRTVKRRRRRARRGAQR